MIKKFASLLVVAVLAVTSLSSTSCTPGGGGVDWNNPALQAEINFIQTLANALVESWIKKHVGGAKSASMSSATILSGEEEVTNEIMAKRPTASRPLVKALVTNSFARKLK